jgi:hemerythrin superfamily protein
MNPAQLLKRDHRTVKALFRKLERASRRSEKQRLGQEIIEELSVHATIEEQLVYPLLRERGRRLEDPLLNALEEHHAVKLTLAELDKMTADDERYDAKMHVVQEVVEMHIAEEEKELLPRLAKLLDREERRQLGAAIRSMKLGAPNHPHPMAPDTPPGNLIAGMAARLIDGGKDVLRGITNEDKARGSRRVKRRAAAAARRADGAATRRTRRTATSARRRRRRTASA